MVLIKAYLLSYNILQVLGWCYVGYLFVKTNIENEFTGVTKCYHAVEVPLKIFQTLALLEVVHSLIRIVSSPWLTAAIQVSSRVFVVWAICEFVPSVKADCIGIPMFVIAWTITEVVRYSFYAANLLGNVPFPIKWMRYSLFIVLYPLGVSGELLSIFKAAGIAGEKGILKLSLPNSLNIAFSYQYFLYMIMMLYIPFFPSLYGYMRSQRKKVLGADSRKKLE